MKIGDTVAAPVYDIFPNRKQSRSRYGYDIGVIVATGKNKKTKRPAVKVQFKTAESTWAKRLTDSPVLEKWCYLKDVDKI